MRIHSNAYADAAAKEEHAHAFAAGRDIYFAQGAYQPHTESGKFLLSHEVAHVLQQTGRRGQDNQMVATEKKGSSEVYRSLDSLFLTKSQITSLTIDKIIQKHRNSNTSKKRAFVRFIRNTLRATPGNEALFWTELKRRANRNGPNALALEPVEVKALAFDLLKFHGAYEEALQVADTFDSQGTWIFNVPEFKTALPLKEFYDHVYKTRIRNLGRILMKIWSEHPFFDEQGRAFGPITFIQDLRLFFLGASRYEKVLDFNNHGFPRASETQINRINEFRQDFLANKNVNLQPNELFFATLIAVQDLLKIRNELLVKAHEEVDTLYQSKNVDTQKIKASILRRNLIYQFQRFFKQEAKALIGGLRASTAARMISGKSSESITLLDSNLPEGVGHKMVEASENARKYWVSVHKIFDHILNNPYENIQQGELPYLDEEVEIEPLYHILATNGKIKKERDVLESVSVKWYEPGGLLALNRDGTIPEPASYQGKVTSQIKRLQKINRTYKGFERALTAFFQKDVRLRSFVKPIEALALGLVIVLVEHMINLLMSYNQQDDENAITLYERFLFSIQSDNEIPNKDKIIGRDDVRIKHRTLINQGVYTIGHSLGINALKDASFRFNNAELDNQRNNIISINSNWEYDPSGEKLDEFWNDFSDNVVMKGLEPFSSRDVFLFFRTMYQNQLAASFLAELKKDEKHGVNLQDPNRDLILNRGYQAALSILKGQFPKRYIIKDDAFVSIYKRQPDRNRESIKRLLLSHWKTVQLLRVEDVYGSDNKVAYLPTGKFSLWIIPSIDAIIKKLRKDSRLSPLNGVIEVVQNSVNQPITVSEIKDLSAKEWWAMLVKSVNLVKAGKIKGLSDLQIFSINSIFSLNLKLFREKLRTDEDESEDNLINAARKVSIFERRAYSVKIRNLLNAYDLGGQITDKVTPKGFPKMYKYQIPDLILDKMDDFVHRQIYPRKDWPYHLAALLLENADLLEKKFNPKNYYAVTRDVADIAFNYLHIIQFALEVSGKTGTNPPDSIKKGQEEFPKLLDESWKNKNTQQPNWRLGVAQITLKRLSDSLKSVLKDRQYDLGLFGKAKFGKHGKGRIENVGDNSSFVIDASNSTETSAFVIDGVIWHIKQIRNNFIYYPGEAVLTHVQLPTNQKIGQSVLKINGKEIAPEDRQGYELIILNKGQGSKDIIVTGDQDDILYDLTYALSMRGTIYGLENLNKLIKGSFTLGLEVLEFIPGPGWVVLATRMFAGIMSFIHSTDFKNVTDIINTVPQQIGKIPGVLENQLTVDNVLDFLIFADNTKLDGLKNKLVEQSGSKKAASIGKKRRRLSKIIEKLKALGLIVFKAFSRIQDGIQNLVERLQVFFFRHPRVTFALNWIMDRLPLLRAKVGGLSSNIHTSELKNLSTNVNKNINNIPENFENIQLPDTLVSLNMLIDLVIRLAVKSAGKKAEVLAEGLMWGLQEAGLYHKIVDAIKSRIVALNQGEDPLSTPWKKAVEKYGNPKLQDAYDAFRDRYNKYLPGIEIPGVLGLNIEEIPKKKVEFKLGGSLEETAPSPNADYAPEFANLTDSLKGLGEGKSIESTARNRAESQFGLDFSHIRLHQDGKAASLSNQLGVDGLASGSHIVLRPGLSLSSGTGQHVFYHELAHTVQQAGAQRLGQPNPQQPSLGLPNRGLRYDKKAEALANRVALLARTADQPISSRLLSQKDISGVQPSPTSFMDRFFDQLFDINSIKEQKRELEKDAKPGQLPSDLDGNIRDSVEAAGKKLFEALNTNDALFKAPFQLQKDDIRKILRSAKAESIRVMLQLATQAQINQPEKVSTAFKGKKQPPKFFKVLNQEELANSLSKYLLVKTGLLIQIEFNKKTPKPNVKNQELIDSQNPFDKLKIVDVFLSEVNYQSSGGRVLWDEILRKNFGIRNNANDKEKAQKFRAIIRSYIRSNFPVKGLWETTSFEFKDAIATDIKNTHLMSSGGDPVDPDNLPTISQYQAKEGPASITGSKALGHIGLRIGKHKDSSQKGLQRESHHTIQFLLLDYFIHDNNKYPFKLLNSKQISDSEKVGLYPGIFLSGSKPSRFDNKNGKVLEIKKMDLPGRGGKMPAILLARPTHRKAGLHVTPGKIDDFDADGDSPSSVVEFWFTRSLGSEYIRKEKESLQAGSAMKFKEYVNEKGRSNIEEKIYKAMNETYEEMYDFMMPRLYRALIREEKNYYNALAEERTGGKNDDYEYTDDIGRTVYAEAVTKTNEIMHGEFKWKKKN
ncbi:MAG: DUF4157 domain-containing protein [Chitinophagales bacterium]|nr:DUF4157 domain-containing protein [Chitinophagales bacterium]